MRFDIAKSGSGLVYEIRNIVNVANRLKRSGVEVIWENIGDPVQKGEKVPDWMREVLVDLLREDRTYGYSPTKGMDATREFLAEKVNRRGKAQITPEDIIFFNGLGDAIARAYSAIRVDVRIIMPEPTYSTHLLAEVLHASFPPNTYRMNPYCDWSPDINELERKVKSHKAIVGILVINPDNPTGYVYPEETLRRIVDIARTLRPVPHLRRDLSQHHLQREEDRSPVRHHRRCAGDQHEGDLQGVPLARFPLRLDGDLQRRQGRDLRPLHRCDPDPEDVGGLLDDPPADGDPPDHDPPGVPALPRRSGSATTKSSPTSPTGSSRISPM